MLEQSFGLAAYDGRNYIIVEDIRASDTDSKKDCNLGIGFLSSVDYFLVKLIKAQYLQSLTVKYSYLTTRLSTNFVDNPHEFLMSNKLMPNKTLFLRRFARMLREHYQRCT